MRKNEKLYRNQHNLHEKERRERKELLKRKGQEQPNEEDRYLRGDQEPEVNL